ncbi:MAG: hypothetical protein ACFFD4_38390 [Candidatus Odinarchaeota archaeon]
MAEVDIFTFVIEWFTSAFNDFFNWYGSQLSHFPFSFVSYAIAMFLLGIFLQLLVDTFRFLRGIVNTLFFPMRVVHVWFHIREAKKITESKMNTENWREAHFIHPRVYVSMSIGNSDDFSRVGLGGSLTTKEAWKIASAPSKGTVFMLLVLTFLTPFLRSGFLGTLVHLYLFCGTALVLLPSSNDYHSVVHSVLINADVHPLYFLWSIAAFAIGFALSMSIDSSTVNAVITGMVLTVLYLFLLVTVVIFLDPRFNELNVISGDITGEIRSIERVVAENQQFFMTE